MALKIEQSFNKYRVSYIGERYAVLANKEELTNVIAHYYGIQKEHRPETCPVCKDITQREQKKQKKGK